jgi:hypothetical protein
MALSRLDLLLKSDMVKIKAAPKTIFTGYGGV